MSTQIILQKISGSYLASSLDLFVYNDDYATLSIDAAIAAVEAAAGVTVPEDILGVPNDGNPGIRQISNSAWEIRINYREPNVRPLSPPTGATVRARFAAQAGRKELFWAPEIDVFDSGGSSAKTFNGVINEQYDSGQLSHIGAVIEPPEPNLFVELAVPIANVTASWGRTVALSVGRMNSTSLTSSTYAAGEIFLCHVLGHQSSTTEFLIDIGWSYKPNVTGESRGPVTGIAYRGHDYVWESRLRLIDRDANRVFPFPEYVIVNEVHEAVDLSAIGIEPP